ncbi:hypothetical protein TBLA_0C02450 [Henningerozyma blattae CBS 6284]|uniref:Ribosome biogenesis protein SLX9 n=1 Tax=Henningerozyma blattae (strain ATCC 34711 / CBS 6284 / DSM 70876 / NBRC 10599 / NRRL Y-10934 / UCD 77-7) TaxID=1071380 RepID=I2H103_HENB6|nr:hypothetical protein TBLA_0C02450 [Tetrapisispora blattae CBS 6284]CCH60055.1 hypothetical protein TBLA_0C02450 [Tetrapisispora blattae CBS 6284]
MAIKKRNTLRNKAANRGSTQTNNVETNILNNATSILEKLPEDPKAFLHQPKESKKDKILNKQSSFLSQVQQKALKVNPSLSGISKSSARRRKRKMRDELKPKMQDLLTSLDQEEDLKQISNDLKKRQAEVLKVYGNNNNNNNNNNANDNDDMDIDNTAKNNVTNIIRKSSYLKANSVIEPGSIKIKKNAPSIRNQKGSKLLTVNETKRFNEVLTNQVFQKNPFGSLRELIKMQKY